MDIKWFKPIIKTIVFFLLPIALLVILVKMVGIHTLIATAKKASLPHILIALVFYFISNFFRTLRFRSLIMENQPTLSDLFYVNSIYNILTATLPAGTGEFSYPLLLKKLCGKSTGFGIGSILFTRSLDLLLLMLVFPLSALEMHSNIPAPLLLLLAISFGAGTMMLFYMDRITGWMANHICRMEKKGIKRLFLKYESLFMDMHGLFTTVSRRDYAWTVAQTIGMWIAVFLFFYFLFKGFGSSITIFQASFIGATLNLLTIIPINTFGGFGIKEAALAGILIMIGFEQNMAISIGIMVRTSAFLCLFILYAGAFLLKYQRHNS